MDEEQAVDKNFTVEPRLHDRWSVLILGLGFIADIAEVVANNTATMLMVAAEHSKQKNFDNKFKEIVG